MLEWLTDFIGHGYLGYILEAQFNLFFSFPVISTFASLLVLSFVIFVIRRVFFDG